MQVFVCSGRLSGARRGLARLHLEAAHPRCIHAAHVPEMAPRADPKAALLSRYASDGYQPPAAASNSVDDDDLLLAARKQVRHSGVARGVADKCTLAGKGLTRLTAGEIGSFTVGFIDRNGNQAGKRAQKVGSSDESSHSC